MALVDRSIDIDVLEFDHEGVRQFLLPLARAEVVAMRDAAMHALAAAARSAQDDSSASDKELLSILLPAFLTEAMRLYEAQALNRRFGALGYRLVTSRADPSGAGTDRNNVSASPFVGGLRRGLAVKRGVPRRLGHRMRRFSLEVQMNGPTLRILRPFNRDRDVVAVQPTLKLIRDHARSLPDLVRYFPSARWFGPLQDGTDAPPILPDSVVLGQALEAVREGFEAGNEELTPKDEDYLRQLLNESMSITSHRLTRLVSRPEELPQRLWTGNGASVWNRILGHATRSVGGKMTAHQHGVGSAHLRNPANSLLELESCDAFVTYTPESAEALRNDVNPDWFSPRQAPSITGLTTSTPSPRTRNRAKRPGLGAAAPIRKLMYTGTHYRGAVPSFAARIHDIVALDWEARLFHHLGQWGFEVLHKPHPASVARPPTGLSEQSGGRVIDEPFESSMDLADAFLFLQPQSSITPRFLASDKPVVFVDLGLRDWTTEAYELLAKRCAIVRARFDDDNRIQVEWDELHSAINEARHLLDTTIVDRYWGSSY